MFKIYVLSYSILQYMASVYNMTVNYCSYSCKKVFDVKIWKSKDEENEHNKDRKNKYNKYKKKFQEKFSSCGLKEVEEEIT